jgi:hypothetical protein
MSRPKYYVTVKVGDYTEHLDMDKFKTILAKNGIDFERAVNIYPEYDEIETKREIDDLKFTIEANFERGCGGSESGPPEADDMEINSVSMVQFADKQFDISEAFNKKFWQEIDELLMREREGELEYIRYGDD